MDIPALKGSRKISSTLIFLCDADTSTGVDIDVDSVNAVDVDGVDVYSVDVEAGGSLDTF